MPWFDVACPEERAGRHQVLAGLLFPGRIFVAATRGSRLVRGPKGHVSGRLGPSFLFTGASGRGRLHRDCLIPPRGQQAPSSKIQAPSSSGDAAIWAQLHDQQCRMVLEGMIFPHPVLCAGRVDQWPRERTADLA